MSTDRLEHAEDFELLDPVFFGMLAIGFELADTSDTVGMDDFDGYLLLSGVMEAKVDVAVNCFFKKTYFGVVLTEVGAVGDAGCGVLGWLCGYHGDIEWGWGGVGCFDGQREGGILIIK